MKSKILIDLVISTYLKTLFGKNSQSRIPGAYKFQLTTIPPIKGLKAFLMVLLRLYKMLLNGTSFFLLHQNKNFGGSTNL